MLTCPHSEIMMSWFPQTVYGKYYTFFQLRLRLFVAAGIICSFESN